jgi:hypothetical protein
LPVECPGEVKFTDRSLLDPALATVDADPVARGGADDPEPLPVGLEPAACTRVGQDRCNELPRATESLLLDATRRAPPVPELAPGLEVD